MSTWISTAPGNPLPEEGQDVLVWYRDFGRWKVYIGHYLPHSKQWRPLGGCGNFNDDITHWMPMPEAPAGAPRKSKWDERHDAAKRSET